MLLLGWITACRRSEIVALDVPDFTLQPDGAEVLIRRSKNDPLGEGLVKVIYHAKREPSLCGVLATQRWLRVSGNQDGPLFCSVRNSGKLGKGRIVGRLAVGCASASRRTERP